MLRGSIVWNRRKGMLGRPLSVLMEKLYLGSPGLETHKARIEAEKRLIARFTVDFKGMEFDEGPSYTLDNVV